MELSETADSVFDCLEAVKKEPKLFHLLQRHIVEVNGFHTVLDRVGEDLGEKFLEVRQLCKPSPKYVCRRLMLNELGDSIQTCLYLID